MEAIRLFFLRKGHLLLIKEQRLIIVECFSGSSASCAWLIRPDELPEKLLLYNSNAQEVDNRIWRHATQSEATNILFYSPDTDVYTIRLTSSNDNTKEHVVQLSVHYATEEIHTY